MICDLCKSDKNVSSYKVEPKEEVVNLCETCLEQIESGNLDENHFNCLNDSMWSENSAVKVLTYRLLKKLWRNDLLDMMYMEDNELAWAEAEQEELRDSNWNILKTWDSVSVIKDLDVKWAWKTLKKWTTIKNIKACEVPWHVACKVDWFWNLYLKVEFLKKI